MLITQVNTALSAPSNILCIYLYCLSRPLKSKLWPFFIVLTPTRVDLSNILSYAQFLILSQWNHTDLYAVTHLF